MEGRLTAGRPGDGVLTGELIAALGSEAFERCLMDFCAAGLRHDAAALMVFPATGPPRIVIDRLLPGERGYLYGDYLAGVYRLSPFYRLALSVRAACVARIGKIAPDNFRASEYYRRYFGMIGVCDMLGVLLPETDGQTLFMSFSRSRGHRAFARSDEDAITRKLPILCAALAVHRRLLGRPAQPSAGPPRAMHSRLTARETEVVNLILEGHSVRAVSQKLGISVETCRVHRRNIYEKLGVNSQAGLFNWYLGSLPRHP